MTSKPLFQHRHYCKIAEILATISDDDIRKRITALFSQKLHGTNPTYSEKRFISAAMGMPINGRDKSR